MEGRRGGGFGRGEKKQKKMALHGCLIFCWFIYFFKKCIGIFCSKLLSFLWLRVFLGFCLGSCCVF